MTQLEDVRAKVVEVQPWIERDTVLLCSRVWEAWEIGTMTEDDFELVMRPITLADVLRAIPDRTCTVDCVGWISCKNGKEKALWNLALPLHEQSPEVIAFLHKILCV